MGSNETGTFAQYFIDKATPITGSIVPAGYAVADMEVQILDDSGREVGYGCPGEIVVKSRYLAVGYWGKPELTRAAFLPDPKGGEKRIYRTGDLGHMRSDGLLECLGRKDLQVKIRGQRVEIEEIEAALMALENIKDAAVVARKSQSDGEEKHLVAYVVPIENYPLSITVARRALEERLPDYMVPSTFVILDALPVTPNGKVDRRALPAPRKSIPHLDPPFVAPSTPIETALAKIWAEMLGKECVGIQDNFFDLGGNSLLAAQVISGVLQTLQVELPVRSFFEVPTVAGLAKLVETIHRTTQGARGSIEGKKEREQGEL